MIKQYIFFIKKIMTFPWFNKYFKILLSPDKIIRNIFRNENEKYDKKRKRKNRKYYFLNDELIYNFIYIQEIFSLNIERLNCI